MRLLRLYLLMLCSFLLGWVLYVFSDILQYGQHIAQEPNTVVLICEIVVMSVLFILSLIVVAREIWRMRHD